MVISQKMFTSVETLLAISTSRAREKISINHYVNKQRGELLQCGARMRGMAVRAAPYRGAWIESQGRA
jgi:hypothetical protein